MKKSCVSFETECILQELCMCTHLLEVDEGDLVDIVLTNEASEGGLFGHPIHFHGYDFRVIAEGKVS